MSLAVVSRPGEAKRNVFSSNVLQSLQATVRLLRLLTVYAHCERRRIKNRKNHKKVMLTSGVINGDEQYRLNVNVIAVVNFL